MGGRAGLCRFFVPPKLPRAIVCRPLPPVLPTSRPAVFARAVLLPLLLALAVVLGLGSYCETSDDGSLAWLFSGVLAGRPVASVPLFLHGYGHLLALAYGVAPAVPWLGLLLAALLAAATALWFVVLERLLRPWLRPGWLMLALGLFFGLLWLEHWLWFSHARVALLLAAGGLLFAAQRPGWRGLLLGLGALLAAWLVRPGLAGMGAAAIMPAVVWLAGGGRRAAPLLLGAGLLLALAFGLNALVQSPAEARVQARDARLALVLDYELLLPTPHTPADSLGTAAVSLWLLGDSTAVDPVLRGAAYHFDAADFLARVFPAKLELRAGLLLRDYFSALLALLATAGAVWRARRRGARGFWLVQLGFALGLMGLAGGLKLPPRLALPLLDCWLLANLIYWLQALPPAAAAPTADEAGAASEAGAFRVVSSVAAGALVGRQSRPGLSPRMRLVGAAVLLLISGLYAAKTWHRHQMLQQEQRRHENALAYIRNRTTNSVRVLAGTNDFLKSLSPFRTYSLGAGPVLQLTGWPAHDAAQARLRQALTGTARQAECLRRLARLPAAGAPARVRWLLTPETARWLSHRLRLGGAGLRLVPDAALPATGLMAPVREYRVQALPKP